MLFILFGGAGLGIVVLVMLLVTRVQENQQRASVERHFTAVQQQLTLMQRASRSKPTPSAKPLS